MTQQAGSYIQAAKPLVGIIMGSDSDLALMRQASDILEELKIPHEVAILSAHRTPEETSKYAKSAAGRGVKAIIAGAGLAAHLAGVVASLTTLPVIGVPVPSTHLGGMDALLSIVQMPKGYPVATVAIGGAANAGLLAARIIAAFDTDVAQRLAAYQKNLTEQVLKKQERLAKVGPKDYTS